VIGSRARDTDPWGVGNAEFPRVSLPRFRHLLASNSVAAILVGGGVPHAFAAGTLVPTSGVNNAGSVSGSPNSTVSSPRSRRLISGTGTLKYS
jgi:hypothetical protein